MMAYTNWQHQQHHPHVGDYNTQNPSCTEPRGGDYNTTTPNSGEYNCVNSHSPHTTTHNECGNSPNSGAYNNIPQTTNPHLDNYPNNTFSNGDYNNNRTCSVYGSANLQVSYSTNRCRKETPGESPGSEYPLRDSPIGGESVYRGEMSNGNVRGDYSSSLNQTNNCGNEQYTHDMFNFNNCDNRPIRPAPAYEEKQIKLGQIDPMSPLSSGLGDPTSPAYAGLFGKIEIHKRADPEPVKKGTLIPQLHTPRKPHVKPQSDIPQPKSPHTKRRNQNDSCKLDCNVTTSISVAVLGCKLKCTGTQTV